MSDETCFCRRLVKKRSASTAETSPRKSRHIRTRPLISNRYNADAAPAIDD